MQKVVIVTEGEWGGLSAVRGDYDLFTQMIKQAIEEAETINILGGRKEKAAEVKLIKTFIDAMAMVENGGVNVLIFISRDMLSQAKIAKNRFGKRLRVVLFTGLIPDSEVIIIKKDGYLTQEAIQRAVLFA